MVLTTKQRIVSAGESLCADVVTRSRSRAAEARRAGLNTGLQNKSRTFTDPSGVLSDQVDTIDPLSDGVF